MVRVLQQSCSKNPLAASQLARRLQNAASQCPVAEFERLLAKADPGWQRQTCLPLSPAMARPHARLHISSARLLHDMS